MQPALNDVCGRLRGSPMERTTDEKQLATRQTQLAELLDEAVEHHNHVEAARAAVANAQQLALFHAWQAGIRLNKMKALVPHGSWQDWLEVNFCNARGISYQTAVLYMKIDKENAELRDVEANLQRVRDLKFDTIRKYAYGFIPEKSKPNEEWDIKFRRPFSFGNIVNEYNRVKYRHISGLQAVDFEEIREETVDLYQFLRWLHGSDPHNPWDARQRR
jgi:hypothetical protein